MRRADVKIALITGLLAFLALTSMASEWEGYWGGEKGIRESPFYLNERIYPLGAPSYQELFPELKEYRMWEWEVPVCYQFVDTPVHSWTEKEKEVARRAIDEWNRVPSPLQGRILEKGKGECLDCEADIIILWEDNKSFFHNWGDPNGDGYPFNAAGCVAIYVPSRVAPPLPARPV